jgi:hypothetical protein
MPTTGIMNGALLRLYVNGVAVAYSTSDTLDLSRAMRETAHKDNTSAWVEVAPGQKSATFSTELMFADIGDTSANTKFNTLFTSWDSGTAITCLYTSSINGDSIFSFTAFIESLSLNAANQESVTASCSLRVNGAITRYTKVPPGVPTSLAAGSLASTSIGLTWVAPAVVGSSAITDYVVQYKLASADVFTTFVDAVSTTPSASVTGLTTLTPYNFRVAAVNATSGQGEYTASISATTT